MCSAPCFLSVVKRHLGASDLHVRSRFPCSCALCFMSLKTLLFEVSPRLHSISLTERDNHIHKQLMQCMCFSDAWMAVVSGSGGSCNKKYILINCGLDEINH